ncbi:MAG: class B sortase [Solobacterium sp.]|nr:class B sortase [Solobacterium sp.]
MRRLRPWVKAVLGTVPLIGTILLNRVASGQPVRSPFSDHSRAEEYVTAIETEPKTLADWKAVNPNVAYVLTFSDETKRRVIPVLKTPNASYALKHNLYGDYDSMGSVFTDPSAIEPENLVIYGHSSKTKDWCFTFLKNYADTAYYQSHPSFQLESVSGTVPCRIISFGAYDLEEEMPCDWADPDPGSETGVADMLKETLPYLIQKTDGIVYDGHGIVTLVTCDMDKKDTRFVMQAVRTYG